LTAEHGLLDSLSADANTNNAMVAATEKQQALERSAELP
jgi:hypothetical protein